MHILILSLKKYIFDNLNSVSISKGISKDGLLNKINNEIYRYDFRYIDYDGYNVIIEGVVDTIFIRNFDFKKVVSIKATNEFNIRYLRGYL